MTATKNVFSLQLAKAHLNHKISGTPAQNEHNFLISTNPPLSEAECHLQSSHVEAAQERIKIAFLSDLDLHTFPVSRYRQKLLTHIQTRGCGKPRHHDQTTQSL
ncbi:hypothetical protein ATANTOWER_032034 [Ataeniobius toweri]|uniref:Uncharacterized protein n=1 Tax=Ataeniobius toweri TaxID=208326 RepID=A0ABU7AV06_9TELE|nr:hypothetical protein [Ataeniobius toweri]